MGARRGRPRNKERSPLRKSSQPKRLTPFSFVRIAILFSLRGFRLRRNRAPIEKSVPDISIGDCYRPARMSIRARYLAPQSGTQSRRLFRTRLRSTLRRDLGFSLAVAARRRRTFLLGTTIADTEIKTFRIISVREHTCCRCAGFEYCGAKNASTDRRLWILFRRL